MSRDYLNALFAIGILRDPVLKDNIYSYVGYGVPLQNAQDQECNNATWQRYIDPAWYTNTRFSIVVESATCPSDFSDANDDINVRSL